MVNPKRKAPKVYGSYKDCVNERQPRRGYTSRKHLRFKPVLRLKLELQQLEHELGQHILTASRNNDMLRRKWQQVSEPFKPKAHATWTKAVRKAADKLQDYQSKIAAKRHEIAGAVNYYRQISERS